MLARIVWILLATLALPSLAFATAEEDVVKAIRDRLDANRRNDIAAAGRVTHFIYREFGATERIVKKVR